LKLTLTEENWGLQQEISSEYQVNL